MLVTSIHRGNPVASYPRARAVLALPLVALMAWSVSDHAPRASADLTFAERMAAQAVIEGVYHRHRAGDNRPFAAAVPADLLERKVRTYLKKSVALQEYWGTSLTAEALRRELQRITAGTQLPDRLREIRAGLGQDEHLLMETFVRAALADRLARRFLARDDRVQGSARLEADRIRRALLEGRLDPRQEHSRRTFTSATDLQCPDPVGPTVEKDDAFEIRASVRGDGSACAGLAVYQVPKVSWDSWWASAAARFDEAKLEPTQRAGEKVPSYDQETASSSAPEFQDLWGAGREEAVPEGRLDDSSVWTGSEMIIWGGLLASGVRTNKGARYDPAADAWDPTSTVNPPSPRKDHTAVWTGSLMIVWGNGTMGDRTGGRYDPVTDSWSPTSTVDAPSPRQEHTAVWTGSRMIVWGGSFTNTGGRYDPIADSWSPTSTLDAPGARTAHSAVWTGTEMIIWGSFFSGFFPTGGRYNPITDQWTPTALNGAPTNRYFHSAVWTGTEMIVWGGTDFSHGPPNELLSSGGRYDPASDSWSAATPLVNAPSARSSHAAVWTGDLMIVWGGNTFANVGGRFDAERGTWTPTNSTRETPRPRANHSAVWTGSELIIWGGEGAEILGDGARWNALTDAWSPTSTMNAPLARTNHTAIWTGSEMIVWGGDTGSFVYTNEGGRYDPAADTWVPTPLMEAPSARIYHTAVWTGSEMIIWGGLGGGYLGTGASYNPATNAWTPTKLNDAPSGRFGHTAVWTGTEMIVWGGEPITSTGGRYDREADQWAPTPLLNAPSVRSGHTAVWTGGEMIVWGGYGPGPGFPVYLRNGGRLKPLDGTWQETSMTLAPEGRALHTAVWADGVMIVWGGIMCLDPITCADFNTGGQYDPETDVWLPTTTTNAPPERYEHEAVWTGLAMIVWGGSDITSDVVRLVEDLRVPWYGSVYPFWLDGDGDGTHTLSDCDDGNPLSWLTPGETTDVTFSPDGQTLGWAPPASAGATSVGYDVLRSSTASDFVSGTVCVETDDASDTSALDPAAPALGGIYLYLVRARNDCPGLEGIGPVGTRSDGTPRTARSCP